MKRKLKVKQKKKMDFVHKYFQAGSSFVYDNCEGDEAPEQVAREAAGAHPWQGARPGRMKL